MYVKKRISMLLFAVLSMVVLTACGRWDYSREAVKAANDAQGETLRVEFKVSQVLTDALRGAVADNIQPADVEKAITMDKTAEKLLTSGYRLDVYALRADVDADQAAEQLAGQFIARLAGCEDEGFISMVKADNGYFYEAVLTYRHGGSGGGSGSSGGDGGGEDEQPDEPKEPPVFPVAWDAVTGTLTFQVGSDGTNAATAMSSESLTENAVRSGLERQAAWLTEHGFKSFESETFDLKKQVQHLVVKSGSGVTAIGSYAFCGGSYGVLDTEGNIMLQSVQLSPEVKDIYQQAFLRCRKLATIDMPGVETIGFAAFSGCSSLANVILTGTTSIGSTAFESCTALTKLSINSSGKDLKISMGGFSTCTSLQEVQISAKNITLKGGYNKGFPGLSIPSGAFTQCTSLETVTLNGCLEEVGECAFALLKNPGSLDFEVELNSDVLIYCTEGLNAFMTACGDHTLKDIGIANENQICGLSS